MGITPIGRPVDWDWLARVYSLLPALPQLYTIVTPRIPKWPKTPE